MMLQLFRKWGSLRKGSIRGLGIHDLGFDSPGLHQTSDFHPGFLF